MGVKTLDDSEKYDIWADFPVENMGVAPLTQGKIESGDKWETFAIRKIRCKTRLHELVMGNVPTAVDRFREYPRFREKPTLECELGLNLHKQDTPVDARSVGDAMMLSEWFDQFSLRNDLALSTTHLS